MNKHIKVEGDSSLVRDADSKALLSTDKNRLEAYMKQRERRLADAETINNLQERMANLEKLVQQKLQEEG